MAKQASLFLLVLLTCLFNFGCLKTKSKEKLEFPKQNSTSRESCHGVLIYRIYRKESPSLNDQEKITKTIEDLKDLLKEKSKINLNLTRNRLTISGEVDLLELEGLLKRAYQEKLISEIIVTGFLTENDDQNKL